jgi:hypothetical protein
MPTVAALVWGNYGRLVSNGSIAGVIVVSVIAINVGLILGSRMWSVPLATDISRLWIDPNSEVAANNELIRTYGNKLENGLNELVTLSNVDGSNMATPTGMTRWAAFMDAVLDTVIYDELTNSTYTILDICNGRNGQTSYTFGCSMYNPGKACRQQERACLKFSGKSKVQTSYFYVQVLEEEQVQEQSRSSPTN